MQRHHEPLRWAVPGLQVAECSWRIAVLRDCNSLTPFALFRQICYATRTERRTFRSSTPAGSWRDCFDQGRVVLVGEDPEITGEHDLVERAYGQGLEIIQRRLGLLQAGWAYRRH